MRFAISGTVISSATRLSSSINPSDCSWARMLGGGSPLFGNRLMQSDASAKHLASCVSTESVASFIDNTGCLLDLGRSDSLLTKLRDSNNTGLEHPCHILGPIPRHYYPTFAFEFLVARKTVQKRQARPKRSIRTPGDDHELGLWIDTDVLRKQHCSTSQIILHDPMTSTNNRYLELANIVLRNGKSNKKAKAVPDK